MMPRTFLPAFFLVLLVQLSHQVPSTVYAELAARKQPPPIRAGGSLPHFAAPTAVATPSPDPFPVDGIDDWFDADLQGDSKDTIHDDIDEQALHMFIIRFVWLPVLIACIFSLGFWAGRSDWSCLSGGGKGGGGAAEVEEAEPLLQGARGAHLGTARETHGARGSPPVLRVHIPPPAYSAATGATRVGSHDL